MKMKQWQKHFLNIWIPYAIIVFGASCLPDYRMGIFVVLIANCIFAAIALAIALQSNENKNHDRTPDCCSRTDAD